MSVGIVFFLSPAEIAMGEGRCLLRKSGLPEHGAGVDFSTFCSKLCLLLKITLGYIFTALYNTALLIPGMTYYIICG